MNWPLDLPKTYMLHLVVTYIMVGIVWVAQLVTYPMYQILPGSVVQDYQAAYLPRAFVMIAPVMLIEAATALRLVMKVRNFELHRTFRSNIALIAIIWIVTFIFEMPSHLGILQSGYEQQRYRTMIIFNLIRLILWMLRAYLLTKVMKYMMDPREVYHQDFLPT